MNINNNLPLRGRRLLIAASGSIAVVKTPILVSSLVKAGAEVKCILTPSACKFVRPISLTTLSRNKCYQDSDQWNSEQIKPLHIDLAEWADLIIVAPLSASSLARWTHGLAEGLLASVLLACECPIIASPAMNTGMWQNKYVLGNWQKLQEDPRVITIPPNSGLLACDRVGDGRMGEPDLIQIAINHALLHFEKYGNLKHDFKGKRFLVTTGPTREKLDPARLLTNRSSGKMGVLLAQAARLRGATVDLIHGPLELPKSWLEGLNIYEITSAKEMETRLEELHKTADVIAMASAITDLTKKQGAEKTKYEKRVFLENLERSLTLTPDLLRQIGLKKTKEQILLGFAALTGNDLSIRKIGEEKRQKKGCDLLMANPIDKPSQGFEVDLNGGWLLGPQNMAIEIQKTSKLSLANQILDEIQRLKSNISK